MYQVILLTKKRREKYSTRDLKGLYAKYNVDITKAKPTVPAEISSPDKQLDCHGMKLWEVKQWLFGDMVGYCQVGYSDFQIIHGYKSGTVIRTYIRNRFQNEFKKQFQQLTVSIQAKEKGITIITIS